MSEKDYCVHKDRKCGVCSLVNYGRDCMNVPLQPEDEFDGDEEGFDDEG